MRIIKQHHAPRQALAGAHLLAKCFEHHWVHHEVCDALQVWRLTNSSLSSQQASLPYNQPALYQIVLLGDREHALEQPARAKFLHDSEMAESRTTTSWLHVWHPNHYIIVPPYHMHLRNALRRTFLPFIAATKSTSDLLLQHTESHNLLNWLTQRSTT